jgi:hypothetical protein
VSLLGGANLRCPNEDEEVDPSEEMRHTMTMTNIEKNFIDTRSWSLSTDRILGLSALEKPL